MLSDRNFISLIRIIGLRYLPTLDNGRRNIVNGHACYRPLARGVAWRRGKVELNAWRFPFVTTVASLTAYIYQDCDSSWRCWAETHAID